MTTRTWPPFGALLVAFLATCAQVPWRPDSLYDGGADPVVVAKAALTLTALGIGVLLVRSRPQRFPVPAAPFLWVSAYLGCSVLGAAADGRLVPTAVLAVRVVLVLLIVAVLVSTYAVRDVLHAFVVVFAILVIAATGTTLALGTTGRLHGGLPPLHANELASLTVICLIWVVGRLFRGEDRPWSLLFVPACIAIIVLTQSRTSLIAGLTALLVLTLFATRVRVAVAAAAVCVPPLLLGIVMLTPVAGQLVTRGETTSRLVTFADRLYAWKAAIAPGQSFSHQWFGGGLSQKTIQVVGQPWTEQVLDSSWVSALVQSGWVGLALAMFWVVSTGVTLLVASREWRGVLLALLVFLALRGFLESGLFDATTSFIVLCVVSFAAVLKRVPREGLAELVPVDLDEPRSADRRRVLPPAGAVAVPVGAGARTGEPR